MELSRKSCRMCLSETEFNVSLYGNYSRRTNLLEKILFCVKIVLDETDFLNTICFKCAGNIERYYDFLSLVTKCQSRLENERRTEQPKNAESVHRRHAKSYTREQVFDADYTFSFLEMADNEEKKECKTSSPFFSYFSPPNVLAKQSASEPAWKTPRPRAEAPAPKAEAARRRRRAGVPRQHSRDLFESSPELDEPELDWRLTPDDDFMTRLRKKCFGQSDF